MPLFTILQWYYNKLYESFIDILVHRDSFQTSCHIYGTQSTTHFGSELSKYNTGAVFTYT